MKSHHHNNFFTFIDSFYVQGAVSCALQVRQSVEIGKAKEQKKITGLFFFAKIAFYVLARGTSGWWFCIDPC